MEALLGDFVHALALHGVAVTSIERPPIVYRRRILIFGYRASSMQTPEEMNDCAARTAARLAPHANRIASIDLILTTENDMVMVAARAAEHQIPPVQQ